MTIRISLRTLLILVFIFCCWLGWLVARAESQKRTVKWIRKNGGVVNYYYQWIPSKKLYFDGDPPGPAWLRNLVGIDMMSSVKFVNLSGCKKINDLTPLASLKQLEKLFLGGVPVKDVKPLTRLKNLESLSLWSTPIAEIRDLENMKGLRSLDLQETSLTEKQISDLQQALPNCSIGR